MVGALSRGLLWLAFNLSMLTAASAAAIGALELHREDVDVSRYPWSAIGKLYNETGASCSGVLIARDKVLTAAHCLFNPRTQRFIPAEALHFLLGYRSGRYAAHVRIARYQIGDGFDPHRYQETSGSDWAVLTVKERLPESVEPLKLSRDPAPNGTKAMIAGYAQDRAHAMTADRDCELREAIGNGGLFLHTCWGIKGFSGAPILVSGGGSKIQIAGIQIASFQSDGTRRLIAVPAQAIWSYARAHTDSDITGSMPPTGVASGPCRAGARGTDGVWLADIQARLDPNRLDLSRSLDEPGQNARGDVMAWLSPGRLAVALQ